MKKTAASGAMASCLIVVCASFSASAAGKADLVNGIVDRSRSPSTVAPQDYGPVEQYGDEGTGAGTISLGRKPKARGR